MDYLSVKDQLLYYIKNQERNSVKVVNLSYKFLNEYKDFSKLGELEWEALEFIYLSSLDIGDRELSKNCLDKLSAKFPDSLRVKRLKGIWLESEQKFSEANTIYAENLVELETHMPSLKRQIAIYKSQGNIPDAIKALTLYLDVNHQDISGWLELSNLYLSKCMYSQAAFCVEELILLDPNHPIYHLKYAEILYTLDKFNLSLKEYCRVLELQPHSVRAFYGIKLCCKRLLNQNQFNDPHQTKEIVQKLDLLATDQLLKKYKNSPEQVNNVLKKFLSNQ
ncbi:protein prenylyltransferase [Conidiobolus coronatus NRRL 28638]|uniref:ER membrane protein complex subunit 2 n=1 Tax=Conidiobolus coronatus (strain ATCC 28846 / CBS 209.66 / NRRL 28638) TaxID=796925 RepID=A0A137PCI4_CONC2|nr:protein prenylyltransferase [Conidiobolus coronatus NRRL 28638]|eukprot:KXN72717.1 protein prenylyltransferase [Conidiobolus coronatus NRRL 28638]